MGRCKDLSDFDYPEEVLSTNVGQVVMGDAFKM